MERRRIAFWLAVAAASIGLVSSSLLLWVAMIS